MACLLRETRRAWQFRAGVNLHPLMFHPDHAVLTNRAQKADLAVAMLHAAWELHRIGESELWTYLSGGTYADLAAVLAQQAKSDFRSLNTGLANRMVFDAWFLSDRSRTADNNLIQDMLAAVTRPMLSDQHFSQNVAAQWMIGLGTLPDGKNYLVPVAVSALQDPLYMEIRDRANANFLWFVKFEYAYRAVEQELQRNEQTSSDGDSSPRSEFETDHAFTLSAADPVNLAEYRAKRNDFTEQSNGISGIRGEVISFFRAVPDRR